MRNVLIVRVVTILGVLMCLCLPSLGRPIDRTVGNSAETVGALLRQPLATRVVPDKQLPELLAMIIRVDQCAQVVALMGLAYAQDEHIDVLVADLQRHVTSPWARGALSFSTRMRKLRATTKDNETLYAHLLTALQSTDNSHEKMFLANRLVADFDKNSLPAILSALRKETNPMVRCDLLYYLAQSDDEKLLKEVVDLEWKAEDLKFVMPEDVLFVLCAFTPGRPKNMMLNSTIVLIDGIKQRLTATPANTQRPQ